MSRIGSRSLNNLSDKIVAGMTENTKFFSINYWVNGIAEEGNFYKARMAIPATLTETEDLFARAYIIWQACRKKETTEERKKWVDMDDIFEFGFNYINYVNN